MGAPILVGLSRKSFIGGIIDAEVDRRLPGTLAADTIALMRGASVLRVHDVVENRAALAVFMALKAAAAPPLAAEPKDDGQARVVLALGGNVGDKAKSLRRALRAIASEPGIELTAVSRLYRTAPWGKTDQDWFVNACALGRTSLKPEALLERVKRLEVELGREPTERWGPRVIDIDLIAYDDVDAQDRTADPAPSRTVQPGLRPHAARRDCARSRDRGRSGRRRGRAPRGRSCGDRAARLIERGSFGIESYPLGSCR